MSRYREAKEELDREYNKRSDEITEEHKKLLKKKKKLNEEYEERLLVLVRTLPMD